MEPTLVLMAAGMGSRYGGLKQLEALGPQGETLMDYGVFDAKRAGFSRVIFVIRKDFEAEFRERVVERYAGHIDVALAFQDREDLPEGFAVPEGREKPWGTGHAFLAARKLLDAPCCVCNADDFYGRDAYASMASFLRGVKPGEAALVGFDLSATLSANGAVSRGVCELRDGLLVAVRERTKLTLDGAQVLDAVSGERMDAHSPVSLNFWGFHPSAAEGFWDAFATFLKSMRDPMKDEFFLPAAVDKAMQEGRLTVRALGGGTQWFGLTYPEDKAAVKLALQTLVDQGEYPPLLFD